MSRPLEASPDGWVAPVLTLENCFLNLRLLLSLRRKLPAPGADLFSLAVWMLVRSGWTGRLRFALLVVFDCATLLLVII